MSTTVERAPERRRGRKLVVTFALLSLAATSVATLGANALFTSTKSTNDAGQNGGTAFASGTVVLNLGAQGANTNSVDVGATGLVPNDTIQRVIDVVNAGTTDFSGVTLATTASASNNLTAATNGLQLKIEECSVAWVKAGGAYTYTCGPTDAGTKTALTNFNNVDVVKSASSVVTSGGQTLNTAGNTAHYRITMTLPNTYAGTGASVDSTTINYTFTATQRAATNR